LFCSRYAICSSKSISTEVCARSEVAAQNKIDSAIAILTLRINPRDARKSHRDVFLALRADNLYRDGRFDRWMRVVADELEIFELKIVNIFYGRIQSHPWQRSAIARKLLVCLFEMVFVKMQIAKGMDKIAGGQADNLRHHHRK